jgi:hypothetical protein
MATLDEIRLQQLLSPFQNQNIGITNTTAATPFINTADILDQYNVPNLQNRDLVDFIIKQNQMKTNLSNINAANTADTAPFFFPLNTAGTADTADTAPFFFPQGQPRNVSSLGFDTSYRVANEPDVEQVASLGSEPSGIAKLLQYLPFGEQSITGLLGQILPKESPEIRGMKNFYGSRYGLTDTGQVASGIMKGYNPVSGGFLNMITGGKYGKPTQFGLARAMQKRIERIQETLKKKDSAQLEKRLENLRNLQREEMQDRYDRGESLSSIGKSTFSGPGMAFEQRGGGFSVKSDGSKRFYGGR